MPRGSRRPRGEAYRRPDAVKGEILLAVAILRQAKKDLRSPLGAVRAEARSFWQDERSMQFWGDLLDCDAARLQRGMQG
jgi:hypothetical protein